MPPNTVSRKKFAGWEASKAFILLYPSNLSAMSAIAKVDFTPAAIRSGAVAPPVATVNAAKPTVVARLKTPFIIFFLLSTFLVTISSSTALFSASRYSWSAASISLSSSSPEGTAGGNALACWITKADFISVAVSITMESSPASPICMVSFCSPHIISCFAGVFLFDIIPI